MSGAKTIPEDFHQLNDVDAVKLFYKAFAPQIEQLKKAESTVESSKAVTKGNLEDDGKSPSRLLFGKDYTEVNRTLTSMLAIKWVLANDYDAFTQFQPPTVKLSKDSFAKLNSLVTTRLPNLDDKHALLVATVVNDQGKNPLLGKEVEHATGQSCEGLNHDEIVYLAATTGLEPIGSCLDSGFRDDVLRGLQFGSKINISQLAQAENVPGNLETALMMRGHPRAFSIKFLEVVFDVAGAGGHVDSRHAGTFLEPVMATYLVALHALGNIIDDKVTLREGYDQVLTARGRLLDDVGYRHLRVEKADERSLLRLLTMGRVTDKHRAELFEEAFQRLAPDIKAKLVDGLNVDGHKDGRAILPYYMPALFAVLLKSTSGSDDATTIRSLCSLMGFLARVYDGTKSRPGEPGEVIERNLAFAETTVRSDAVKTNSNALENIALPWEQDPSPTERL